ncbi:hypothetical protein F5148DRAFT_166697 [Russula earlei]|uniref:Uncharacterized protein n=1 Tax=Russula earlei TaxID=71964 RepID=A0ACC0U6M4_9AGAM|nr:hypothetical protein F5148DRAFT_166697 [Russula earlei]
MLRWSDSAIVTLIFCRILSAEPQPSFVTYCPTIPMNLGALQRELGVCLPYLSSRRAIPSCLCRAQHVNRSGQLNEFYCPRGKVSLTARLTRWREPQIELVVAVVFVQVRR